MALYPDHATNYEAREYWIGEIIPAIIPSEIAGGQPYAENNSTPRKQDADVTVSTAEELANVLNRDGQEVVWVTDDINLGERTNISITSPKLIAGNRGQNGSPGPLIYTENGRDNRPFVFECYAPVTWSGLRLRGPTYDYWDSEDGNTHPEYPGYLPLVDDRYDHGAQFATFRQGSNGSEVENCEVYGWSIQAFGIGSSDESADVEIHHSYLHDNMMTSYGYAWTIYRGHVHTHHCLYDAHRHDIAGFGYEDATYVIEDNIFGPSASSHRIDMHAIGSNRPQSWTTNDEDDSRYHYRGGGGAIIRRNTFLNTNVIHGPEMPGHSTGFDRGRFSWVYSNRGVPKPGSEVVITKNSLMHPGPQDTNCGRKGSVRNRESLTAFIQNTAQHTGELTQGGFARVRHDDNLYDNVSEGYHPEYGAPINIWNPVSDGPDIEEESAFENMELYVEDLSRIRHCLNQIQQVLRK